MLTKLNRVIKKSSLLKRSIIPSLITILLTYTRAMIPLASCKTFNNIYAIFYFLSWFFVRNASQSANATIAKNILIYTICFIICYTYLLRFFANIRKKLYWGGGVVIDVISVSQTITMECS